MKYSISNIAWSAEYDNEMYAFLKQQGIEGLEIAPTRLFTNPYDNLELAHEYAWMLKNKYGLTVSSMQSIWYGIKESIFGTEEDRQFLIDYTKKAILFAESMGIKNLVFGCPRNRNMPQGDEKQYFEIDVYPFWKDKAIVEIELSSEDQEVIFQPQLKMIREVTGEKEFKNASLARRR